MKVRFLKMHGCGNDFVILDERATPLGLTLTRVAGLADRHTGIGCDQFITIEPAPVGSGADAFMRIRNPDGSEAGACGNATRCVAMLLWQESGRRELVIRTAAGNLPAVVEAADRAMVDMGAPRLDWRDVPLAAPINTLSVRLSPHAGEVGVCSAPGEAAAVSMGNPHATFFVDDVTAVPITELGPHLERDPLFPERANIGFAQVLGPDRLRLRVWERGAGLTRACGSGACAAAVNAHRRGLTGRRVRVEMDGGMLDIHWRNDGHVLMAGPVATTFTGEIDLSAYPR